ncbi:MAG: glycosyltransferase [candidate division KSB1 bacterium]|nr:glycosyltransferase [candidate division KSB1 bacterium]
MKVLFVSSGNNQWGITPIVKAQGESLKKEGVELDYFTIQGKGVLGYLGNLPALRERIESFEPDLVHAHYSLSAITASFACTKPMVVSLMGSDTVISHYMKWIIALFARLKWQRVIVKSRSMLDNIGLRFAEIIPNGVETNFWQPKEKESSKRKVGFDIDHPQVVWLAESETIFKELPIGRTGYWSGGK